MSKRGKTVSISQEEQKIHQEAEKLKAAGMAAFGDPTPDSFDLNKDMQEIAGAGIVNDDPMTKSEITPGEVPLPNNTEEQSSKEEKPGVGIFRELPEDPMKKLEQVCNILSEVSNSPPGIKQLLGWKQLHGDLFLLQMDENQIYLYRYIKYQEWRQMLADEQNGKLRSDQFDDVILERCLLWPALNIEARGSMPAGLTPTIVEQIRRRSMFLDPNHVAQFTLKI